MKPHPESGKDTRVRSSAGDRDAVFTLLITMADTTWRIFTPVILCTGLGIWADVSYGTKPWLTFTGVIIGFTIAALLIRNQIKRVKQ